MSILSLSQVDLHFPLRNRPVLQNINYEIKSGDFVILLGSNGSGKSSLLKLIHRDYQASSGKIDFLNRPLSSYDDRELSQHIAVLSQDSHASMFPSLSVLENFLLRKQIAQQSNSTTITRTDIINCHKPFQDYVQQFNPALLQKMHERCDHLSGGEKQSLVLALVLLKPPKLLLLDEHTSALDPKTAQKIMALTHAMLVKYNISCILTTHDLDLALNYGNRILILHQGKVRECYEKENVVSPQTLSKEQLITHYC